MVSCQKRFLGAWMRTESTKSPTVTTTSSDSVAKILSVSYSEKLKVACARAFETSAKGLYSEQCKRIDTAIHTVKARRIIRYVELFMREYVLKGEGIIKAYASEYDQTQPGSRYRNTLVSAVPSRCPLFFIIFPCIFDTCL